MTVASSRVSVLALLSTTIVLSCASEPPTSPDPFFLGSGDFDPEWVGPAAFFAPVIYQDVDASAADFLTNFGFDVDWNGGNNWENVFSFPLKGWLYVSMVETESHYFIHYGTFHPRDWCQGPFCWISTAEHENDLEGLTLTVDKRFATSDWPYGQIHTVELVFHNATYPAYNNCSFSGYTVTPTLGFKPRPPEQFDGCVTFVTDPVGGTEVNPPSRVAIFIEARGHGVKMRSSSWSGFPGSDGVIYFPSDLYAEVPESFYDLDVLYRLQWFHQNEVWYQPSSLWAKRLTSGGLPTSTYRLLHEEAVGPFDVLYGYVLNCQGQPCGAHAPWGQKKDHIQAVHLGDWHNHPAWAWSQHYEPGPSLSDTLNYPYCRDLSCRMDSTVYLTNMFWDADEAPEDYVDYGVAALGQVAQSPAQERQRPILPERRWDFDRDLRVRVRGPGLLEASLVRLPDTEWGYSGGSLGALRVKGSGEIEVELLGDTIDARDYQTAIVRLRPAFGGEIPVDMRWKGEGQPSVVTMSAGTAVPGWQVLTVPLTLNTDWRDAQALESIRLTLHLGSGPPGTVDIDFIIIAPQ